MLDRLCSADVDQPISLRLKNPRFESGQPKSAAADALGVNFQQIQKHKTGRNRVVAGGFFSSPPHTHAVRAGTIALEPVVSCSECDRKDYVCADRFRSAHWRCYSVSHLHLRCAAAWTGRMHRRPVRAVCLAAGPPNRPKRKTLSA